MKDNKYLNSEEKKRYSDTDTYEVIDKAVTALKNGDNTEIVTTIILQNFEYGVRIALTCTRCIPNTNSYYTESVSPMELVVVGDEVILDGNEITDVIVKKTDKEG